MAKKTILVIGSTGNTGVAATRQLAKLAKGYRILALTRNAQSPAAKELAGLENVEVEECNWAYLDGEFLASRSVEKAYVAAANSATQFTDEMRLYCACIKAGVKYVVRISTTKYSIGPASPIYYGRTHWAVEAALAHPDFKDLCWTSLQPAIFTTMVAASCAQFVQEYRKTGKQGQLKITFDEKTPVAVIEAADVGLVGAKLLAMEDYSQHNQQKYILGGPENITGQDMVNMVSKIIGGEKVQDVSYRNMDFLDYLVEIGFLPERFKPSLFAAVEGLWEGKGSLEALPTSQAVMDFAPPSSRCEDILKEMVQ